MIKWNEQRLKELVRRMELQLTPGQGEPPIHLSLYNGFALLLTQIMRLDAKEWRVLGYDETDRVSVTRYLESLGCRTSGAFSAAVERQKPLTPELAKALIDTGAFDEDVLSRAAQYQQPLTPELAKLFIDAGVFDEEALSVAAQYQHPLTPELAKLLVDTGNFDERVLLRAAQCQQPLIPELAKTLIDAGTFDKEALSVAAIYQHPLSLELAKLLIDAGCDPVAQNGNGWDVLVHLAWGGHPVDPQVTDLFLSAGCRTDLGGCSLVSNEQRIRFDQILEEHALWKESLDRTSAENVPADLALAVDWGL